MKTCNWDGCDAIVTGKYCGPHRKEARETWRANREAERSEREQRYARFAALVEEAHQAGLAAGRACTPQPMVINGYAPILDGVCGFAEVRVTPGTSSFARWAKKHAGFSKHYYGGIYLWVGEFNQSYERKMAYATEYAKILSLAGITATPSGRLD